MRLRACRNILQKERRILGMREKLGIKSESVKERTPEEKLNPAGPTIVHRVFRERGRRQSLAVI